MRTQCGTHVRTNVLIACAARPRPPLPPNSMRSRLLPTAVVLVVTLHVAPRASCRETVLLGSAMVGEVGQ